MLVKRISSSRVLVEEFIHVDSKQRQGLVKELLIELTLSLRGANGIESLEIVAQTNKHPVFG